MPFSHGIADGGRIVQTSRMKKLIIPVLALLLAGCGFHLRGSLNLADQLGPIRVVSPDPYSPLAESLAQALLRAGASAPADPKAMEGVATLEILSERWGTLPISLDSQGRGMEFSLRYATIFVLRDGNGRDIVTQQVIELQREYVAQATDSVGQDSEAEILGLEMRREMTASILRRVEAASRQH